MSEDASIQVNFGKPIPLFPLNVVSLLPQQILPLHIFEPRYKQLFEHALDSSGQVAMAVYSDSGGEQPSARRSPLRRAVCLGHIVQHEKLPDGRLNIFLQGLCRARIIKELPRGEDRLYRTALLEPLDTQDSDPEAIAQIKASIQSLFARGGLQKLVAAPALTEWLANEDLPDRVLLELISLAIIHEPATRYRLLSEPDASARGALLLGELKHLERLVRLAKLQRPEDWPKGCSWN